MARGEVRQGTASIVVVVVVRRERQEMSGVDARLILERRGCGNTGGWGSSTFGYRCGDRKIEGSSFPPVD